MAKEFNFDVWYFLEIDGKLVAGFPTYSSAVTHKQALYKNAENIGICSLNEYFENKRIFDKQDVIDYYASHLELSGSEKIGLIKAIRILYDISLPSAMEVYKKHFE